MQACKHICLARVSPVLRPESTSISVVLPAPDTPCNKAQHSGYTLAAASMNPQTVIDLRRFMIVAQACRHCQLIVLLPLKNSKIRVMAQRVP